MSIVVPSVTAPDAVAYREQMARVALFAKRVHIDCSDGLFAPVRLINPAQVYWPEGLTADIHLMYQQPASQLETVISLQPELVIIQAEAQGDLMAFIRELKARMIKVGVALLQPTEPQQAHDLIAEADHVLIFSGTLGKFGGVADKELLKKVSKIRAINTNVEIGWDGGVTTGNAADLVFGGVDVLIAGGAIHKAPDPAEAYKEMSNLANKM